MTEEQPYAVVEERAGFELRRYPEHVVAETRVRASFEDAGSKAFRRLAGYLGGHNARSETMAMTAPVLQEVESSGAYAVSFVLPKGLPVPAAEPADRDVRLRTVPAQTAAALRFSGRWSRRRYDEHATRLLAALQTAGLEVDGPLRFARFDPPWTPWFLRRNEVVAPVVTPP